MKIQRSLVTIALGGALAVGLAACGSSSSGSAAPAPASQAQSRGGNRAGGPAASGTIAAVNSANIEVQGANGQVTVNYSGSTTFNDRVSATLADVTQGSCVVVAGTGTRVAATSVQISTAGANGCTAGFGGGAGGARPQGGQGGGTRAPRPSGTARPGGGARGTFGKVTAVTGTGFTVEEDNRQTGATTDVQVTVSAGTTYEKTQSSDATALKVGECATATGQSDDTGAVTATAISLSQAGPNGCTSGRPRGAGGTGAASGGANG
ncbi:MAG TPA: DUF5666 domain-containing protein [Amycolatopsis sp.]|nr:DUF5666 domain-containing protein [Amycolatopsis sp.]